MRLKEHQENELEYCREKLKNAKQEFQRAKRWLGHCSSLKYKRFRIKLI
jgi:hypothetical protein